MTIILSTLISFLLTPVNILLSKKFGLIDDPSKNKHPKVIHKVPIPRGGSLTIFISIFVTSVLLIPLNPILAGTLISCLIILITGLLDDKFDLSPYLRLGVQFIAAAIPVATGLGIAFITNPVGGTLNLTPFLASAFAVFWIVFLMNGLNFGAKGVDGQLSGVVVVAALTIYFLSLKVGADTSQIPIQSLALILAGSFLGFLPWHIYPQKIMPGWGGSNLAGLLLGILSVAGTAKVGTLMVVLAIPLIDTGFVLVRRVVSGKSPFWGDRGHLHHRLLDMGHLTVPQVALFYWIGSALLGLISLNLTTTSIIFTIIGTGIFVGGLILWLTYKPKS